MNVTYENTKRIPANSKTRNVLRLKGQFVPDAGFITMQNEPLTTDSSSSLQTDTQDNTKQNIEMKKSALTADSAM